MSITEDAQTSILEGVADSMRRAPVIYAILLEFVLIMGFVWWIVNEEHKQREMRALQEKALQAQLVECLRSKVEQR